ncbi:hypothetical protein Hanom_Chr09g00817931 [Helianthus anomalus]
MPDYALITYRVMPQVIQGMLGTNDDERKMQFKNKDFYIFGFF